MDPMVAAVLGAAGAVVLILLALVLTGASPGKLGLGMAVMRKAAQDAEFEKKIDLLLNPPPPEPPKPVKPSGAPLRLLAVMQRESRLVDFLLDDLSGADDAQVAAAVREIQSKAQAALKKHVELEAVIGKIEGEAVEVPAGFDASAVQLVGNVTGKPPFRGTLQHAGWRVTELKLAPLPEGHDEFVLAPAVVELP